MKKSEMLTIRNAEVRITDERTAVVFNKWQSQWPEAASAPWLTARH